MASEWSNAVLVAGNCQASIIARCMRCLEPELRVDVQSTPADRREPADWRLYRHVFAQPQERAEIVRTGREDWLETSRITWVPPVVFSAFHPDAVYVKAGGKVIDSPIGAYHSSLILHGYKQGLGKDKIAALFRNEVYAALGFYEFWEPSRVALVQTTAGKALALGAALERWRRQGVFMHTINHPKLFVLADIARILLRKAGIEPSPLAPEDILVDPLVNGCVWPVYPEVGSHLGLQGNYVFKSAGPVVGPSSRPQLLNLGQMIERSLDLYRDHHPDSLSCERLESGRYEMLLGKITRSSQPPSSTPKPCPRHPYQELPRHQFWRHAVGDRDPAELDPVAEATLRLGREDRVATAGSCFAQHMSRALQASGYHYFVAEKPEYGLTPDEAAKRNFGIFSTRSGNIYTARQLLQLFQRAYGELTPAESRWDRPDGRFVDALRPRIEPEGFVDCDAVEASREDHFAAVRTMFEELDVFVFTLGLTEGWMSRLDGTIFPLAPGVAGGQLDGQRHRFVNFSLCDVVDDLGQFLARLETVNRSARIVLTVSPVPLTATYERQHVLVSTTYSKSVLRVAANEISQSTPSVTYFPSYEIIMGGVHSGCCYFARNRRDVTSDGVAHVMRIFMKHYCETSSATQVPTPERATPAAWLSGEIRSVEHIVCEEELLDPQLQPP